MLKLGLTVLVVWKLNWFNLADKCQMGLGLLTKTSNVFQSFVLCIYSPVLNNL